jgi:hypothetical protein
MLAPLLSILLVLNASPDAPGQTPSDAPRLPPASLTEVPAARPVPVDRAARITVELLVAGAAGVGVGALGGYVGCLASPTNNGQSCSTSTIAAVGLSAYGLTIAAVVPLSGNAMGGDGLAWVSWLGEAAGLGGGLLIAQGNPKNAMFFCAPLMLVGAITGYELTAGWGPPAHTTSVVQAVAVQPVNAGATVAVSGRF